MKLARFENILGLETASGKLIGFHTRNLQVAHLDRGAFESIQPQADSDGSSEARSEIESWNREIDVNAVDADIPQQVRYLMVNVAQVCNLKCVYCAAGGDGSFGDTLKHIEIEKVYEQIRMVLHDIPRGETFSLTFFGGEPLVAPETIRQLARFTRLQVAGRDIRVKFRVITNATLVTPAIAELLASIGCHVMVSLDGPPEINDKNRPTRGGLGSTERTIRGIDELVKVRDRLGSITANAVFGKHNTDVLATYKFLREFSFDSMNFDFAAETDDSEASRAYQESLAKTADFAYLHGGENELRKIEMFDAYFKALDEQRRLNNHCGAGKSHLTIDGRGRATACQWFVGQSSEDLGQAGKLDHERLKSYAPRLNELNNCQSCWARYLCGGGCMFVNQLKNGSKHKKDNDFCDRTRRTLTKVIEYYAEARIESENEGDGRETH